MESEKTESTSRTEAPAPPAASGNRDWLAALLLRRPDRWTARLTTGLVRLWALPRGYRRRLQRKVALTAAGAALVLAMSAAPFVPSARAATITVDGVTCTLIDAILAANTNAAVGGCVSGDAGVDTIDLQTDTTLTASFGNYFFSDTGLPLVVEDLIIEGNDFTIERDTADPDEFRILAVADDVDLTVNDTTISGGATTGGEGGGIYFAGGEYSPATSGDLIISGSTISDNTATFAGGGISHDGYGNLTIENSVISGNDAGAEGGGLYFDSNTDNSDTADITNSRFEGNYAVDDGGAIYHDGGVMTIEDSVITGNEAGENGGGIYVESSSITIRRTTMSNNTAGYEGGGIYNDGDLTIEASTISGNDSDRNGGGIFVDDTGSVAITNSTISGNSAVLDGGGIRFDEYNGAPPLGNVIIHTTITGNTAGGAGGGVSLLQHPDEPVAVLVGTLISGNTATGAGDEIHDGPGNISHNDSNVLGDSSKSNADAFDNFLPGVNDISATSDGTDPTAIGGILNTTLADNGGPTETHLLVAGSPALDTASDGPAADQRGAGRPIGTAYDSGAVEGTVSTAGTDILMSTRTAGTTDDGLDFGPEDIIYWDGSEWSLFFDGSAAGLTPTGNAKHDINAFYTSSSDFILLSFAQNGRSVPGVGKVDGMDAVVWNGSFFQLVFDGQDVGLTNKTQEKIDGLHLLDGAAAPPELIAAAGGSCQVYMLVSTQGPGKVPEFDGGVIRFSGEDVLGFCFTSNGDFTSGKWIKVLDGSDEGMPKNSTDSISFSADSEVMYLTTKNTFDVDAATGGHSMVYRYDFAGGEFSGPFFIAADNGLDEKVDGLQVQGELP